MKITIGSDVFDVPAPKGMKSFALQQKLLPVVSRVAQVFFFVVFGKKTEKKDFAALMDADIDESVFIEALPLIGQIFEKMPDDELEKVTRILLGGATVQAGAVVLPLFAGGPDGDLFDAKLQGRAIDTWRLLWFSMKVWYPDYFSGAAARFAAAAAKKTQSKSPAASATNGPASASLPADGAISPASPA